MTPPVLLGCRELSKAFDHRPLFEKLSFSLHEGDRTGLVGPNGAGKSTLIRILADLERPDSGECFRRKGLRVALVPQRPEFPTGVTARDVVCRALAGVPQLDAHEREARAAMALGKQGFEDAASPAETLSGGWRTRLAIARALALEPDLLLLDEPTNHLDLEAILSLEELLRAERRAFVVVSHDRAFLQRVATRMLDIDRVYPDGMLAVDGGWTELLEARHATLSAQAAYERALANRVRREIEWLRRGPKARTSKARARIEAATQSIDQLRAIRERGSGEAAGIEVTASGRKTRRLWSCRGLTKGFGGRTIVDDLDLLLTPGTRLGVLGANGTGKTTLLEMIVGRLAPDSGTIRAADDLRTVYFDQTRESVDPELSLERALAPEGDQVVYRGRAVHVVSWARRFLFRREQLATPVGRLSGGERARVVLARMMLRPADLLVLDEPTNDLDIPTLELLEESLLEFPGALVLVTHDRNLLDRVSTSILALDGYGGVQSYAETAQWVGDLRRAAKSRERNAPPPRPRRTSRKKLSYLEQREWDGMEAEILAAEERLAQARQDAEDPAVASDAAELEKRHLVLDEAQRIVDRLYARWAELEAGLDG